MAVTYSYGQQLLKKITGWSGDEGSCYIGLCTAEPEYVDVGGTPTLVTHELTASAQGYSRQAIGIPEGEKKVDTFSFDISTGRTTGTNGTDTIFFPEAENAWGTVSHFILARNKTGEPMLCGTIVNAQGTPTPVTVAQNEVVIFKPEQLKLSI